MGTSPGRITLRFDQQIRPISGGTDVVNEQNRSVLGGTVHNAPNDVRVLVIPLQPGLPRGDYTVRWGIVSTDGHLISGVFAIGVGSGLPPPQAVSEQSSPLDYPFLSARCLYFAGLLLLVGGTVFRVLVYRPAAATIARENRALADLRERHRANQVLALSAVLALGGGWVALTKQGADVAGVSFWRAFDHRGPVASALQATRFGQVFGRGIDITAAFTLLVAAAYAVAPLRRRLAAALVVPAAAAGVWVLAVPGMSGHAGDPGRSSLTIALDAVHVAAAAVWIGGLLHLFWVTPHATRGLPEAERERVRHEIARRFSRVALASVAALSASGAARALWEVDAVSKLWTTGYGRTLLVKTALLAVLVALGYRNRRALDRFRSLRRSVAAELVLAAMVLGAVALLTNLPPALSPPRAAQAASGGGGIASLRLQGGARLTMWPGRAGANVFAARLPAGGAHASLLLQSASGRIVRAQLTRVAAHEFTAIVPAVPAGAVTAQIAAGAGTWGATLSLGPHSGVPGVPPPPASQGAVAAAEAGDLAVAAQRSGRSRATLTVLAADGSTPRDLLIMVDGRPALPCTGTASTCYSAPVPAAAADLRIEIRRPSREAVSGVLRLPAANAPPAAALVRRAASVLRGLRSLRVENDLASDPTHSVHTTFIVQAPDRLSVDVRGGLQSRIIGKMRWDRQPGAGWVKQQTPEVSLPDPFWAPGATAAHVSAVTRSTVQVTLAVPTGPTFFRLTFDRRTLRIADLLMITAAHFMHESYHQYDSAPPVRPPS